MSYLLKPAVCFRVLSFIVVMEAAGETRHLYLYFPAWKILQLFLKT